MAAKKLDLTNTHGILAMKFSLIRYRHGINGITKRYRRSGDIVVAPTV